MSSDNSRFTYDPWNDFKGVVMEQGKVQLDSDWNEWGSENYRRTRSVNLDTLGQAIVPVTQTNGFLLTPSGSSPSNILINPGRMYVDGLAAENFGLPTNLGGSTVWNPRLDEMTGITPVPYTEQPYLPGAALPTPGSSTTNYLAYVDVWQRERSWVESPELVEKAVGIDTTSRLQTLWQVKLAQLTGDIEPLWTQVTQPSAARLTTEPFTPGPNYYFEDEVWTAAAAVPGVNTFYGVAVDPVNSIVYAATGNSIQSFDLKTGKPLGALNLSTRIYQVESLFFGIDGFLYLAEEQMGGTFPFTGTIYKVNPATGQVLAQIGPSSSSAGTYSVFPTGSYPTTVFVDLNGDIYAGAGGPTQVYWFQASAGYAPGTLVLPSSPTLYEPAGIFKWNGTLYISDAGNISNTGQLVGYDQVSGGTYDNGRVILGSPLFRPSQITMDILGNLYIAGFGNIESTFFVLTVSGQLVQSPYIIRTGSALGIGVDQQGNVYVSGSQMTKISNTQQSKYTGLENQLYRVEVHQGGIPGLTFSGVTSQWSYTNPTGLATDSTGSVYVSGLTTISKFDPNGVAQPWGPAQGTFSKIGGICLGAGGKLYTVDNLLNLVQVFDANGNLLLSFGGSGSGNGQFNLPSGISVDLNGNVYVADTGNKRVQSFNSAGTYLNQWNRNTFAAFVSPVGVVVDPTGRFVYVLDGGIHTVSKFDTSGNFLNVFWGTGGTTSSSINCDGLGNIYVTNFSSPRFYVYDPNGNLLNTVGNSSVFTGPQAIAVDGLGHVYVADATGGRVVKFTFATPTFKWSRENGSVVTPVTAIQTTNNETLVLTVANLGRDAVLGFSDGDWVELTDDTHELNGLPGEMHQIVTGGVDSSNLTITVANGPAGTSFTATTSPTGNLRLVRWDQKGVVYRNDGTTIWYDLDSPQSVGAIPVPPVNTTLILESGIEITFSLDPSVSNGKFNTGDYWTMAARTEDQSIQALSSAPPQGIYHHYAQLALLALSPSGTITVTEDLRNLWTDCDCGVWVTPYLHNNGIFTIQQAVNWAAGLGGTVWLTSGNYNMNPSNISGPPPSLAATAINAANPVVLRGQGESTVLTQTNQIVFLTQGTASVTIQDLKIVLTNSGVSGQFPAIDVTSSNSRISNVTFDCTNAGCIAVNNATNVVIEDLNIINGGGLGTESPTIGINNSDGVVVRNVVAQNMPNGFLSGIESNNVLVERIQANSGSGLALISNSGCSGFIVRDLLVQNYTGEFILDFESSEAIKVERVVAQSMPSVIVLATIQCQSVSINDIVLAQATIGFRFSSTQQVQMKGVNAGVTQVGVQIQNGSCDIVIDGFKIECPGVAFEISPAKNVFLKGLDIYSTGGTAVGVANCVNVSVSDSTMIMGTGATPLGVSNTTGFKARNLAIQTQGSAALFDVCNDVDLENLEVVSACDGGSVIQFGQQCANVRLANSSIVANPAVQPSGNPNIAAVILTGWVAGTEIQGNSIQSPIGIANQTGSYLSTLGLLIENNLMVCTLNGVSFQGNVFMTGVTRVAGNTISESANGGVVITGATYLGAVAEVASNQISGTGPGILVGTDTRISANTISATGTGTAPGIVLGGGLNRVIAHCLVTDNRVIQTGGYGAEGILIQQALQDAVISGNVFNGTRSGLVFRDEGAATGILIQDNTFTNIQAATTTEPTSAIGVFNTVSARIIGNVISGVTTNAGVSEEAFQGGGIMTVACEEQHHSDNELVDVESGLVTTMAMGVFGPFDRVDIEKNEMRIDNTPVSNTPAGLAAPFIVSLNLQSPAATGSGGSVIYLSPDTWIANLDNTNVLVSNGNGLTVTTWPTGRVESVRVIGNRLEGISAQGSVLLTTTGECHFADNYCVLPIPISTSTAVVAQITAGSAMIHDNRVRGGGHSIGITLPTSAPLVLMDNMATQSILLNGSAIPTVWQPYNVTA